MNVCDERRPFRLVRVQAASLLVWRRCSDTSRACDWNRRPLEGEQNDVVGPGSAVAVVNHGRSMAVSSRNGSMIGIGCAGLLAAAPVPLPAAQPVRAAESALVQSIRAAQVASAYGMVTSIYRSPAHNRAVGGVPNSFHLAGRAIDVARRPGVSHFQVAAMLRKAGYDLIESIDEGDHSHFAFRVPGAEGQMAAAAVEPAPVAEKPKPNLVLADDHGELLLDLAPKPTLLAGAASGPGNSSLR